MTQSVVIDVVYPDFVKLRSDGKHKEYPVLCKFKTLRLIDQVTGEPSLNKLNELVQEALCALLLGGGDSADIPPARFCYFYTDHDGDRILIATSEALKAALEDCSADEDSLKIQLTIKPTEPRLRLVHEKKDSVSHLIELGSICSAEGTMDGSLSKLKSLVLQVFRSNPYDMSLTYTGPDGNQVLLVNDSDLNRAINELLHSFDQTLVVQVGGKEMQGPTFVTLECCAGASNNNAGTSCRLVHRERIYGNDGLLSCARLLALASETLGLVAVSNIKLSYHHVGDGDDRSVAILNDFDLSDVVATCPRDRIYIRATALSDGSAEAVAEAETDAKQLVLGAKSSVCEDDKCAEHKEDDNIAELPTEKGLDAVAGDATATSSSSKSLPSNIAFSLLEKVAPQVHTFALKIICYDGGVPSFDKFIHLVAGIYKVHPARVSLILDSPIETEMNPLVQGDRKLREALETSTGDMLSFRVAFTKPKLINLSIKGEDRSFRATGGVSYETLCSIVTSQLKCAEPPVGASWKYKGKVPSEIVTIDKEQYITSNEVLMDILHNIPGEQVKFVASFVPAAVLLPTELATLAGSAKLGTGQDPQPIEMSYGNEMASWNLSGMIPGIYKATFLVSYGNSGSGYYIHVGITSEGGDLSSQVAKLREALPKLTRPASGCLEYYVESSTASFEVSGLPNEKFVAVVYNCQVNIRSVVLDYVGPLPNKS